MAGPNQDLSKVEFSDIIFFRFGFYNYIKLNTESMVHKFNRDEWYTVNLLINYAD